MGVWRSKRLCLRNCELHDRDSFVTPRLLHKESPVCTMGSEKTLPLCKAPVDGEQDEPRPGGWTDLSAFSLDGESNGARHLAERTVIGPARLGAFSKTIAPRTCSRIQSYEYARPFPLRDPQTLRRCHASGRSREGHNFRTTPSGNQRWFRLSMSATKPCFK
jgi:hypothetical protein